jgi:hypothetical protein
VGEESSDVYVFPAALFFKFDGLATLFAKPTPKGFASGRRAGEVLIDQDRVSVRIE